MRKIKSTPKDRAFYNEHGASLKAYGTLANLGQLLSALSLALAVFSILRDAIAGYGFTPTTNVLTAVAILIGLFVELANRLLARPSIRPLVVKDQFADQPEKRQRHKLLTRLSRIGLVVVGLLSLFLSWRGSMDAGKLMTAAPPAVKVDSLAADAANRLQAVNLAFAADTAVLLSPYAVRAAAARQQFSATAAERTKAAQDFDGCAGRGNKWCKQQRRARLGEIDAARATLAATLATIASERGQALAQALARRDAAAKDVTGRTDAALSEAKTTFATATGEADAKASATGYIFAVLTLIGQLTFYLMTYLILMIEAGSEIEEDLQPNEFHYLPSVTADLRAIVSHRVERGARRLIRWAFGDRERLADGLPYVQVWDAPVSLADDADVLATGSSDTSHAPGFYRAADDPHTKPAGPTSRALYSTPATPTHTRPHTTATHTKAAHETPESREAKQRLKQYLKRLGEHTQKAKVQQRKNGTVSVRTVKAIENNRQWVDHYKQVLNTLENG